MLDTPADPDDLISAGLASGDPLSAALARELSEAIALADRLGSGEEYRALEVRLVAAIRRMRDAQDEVEAVRLRLSRKPTPASAAFVSAMACMACVCCGDEPVLGLLHCEACAAEHASGHCDSYPTQAEADLVSARIGGCL